jgi:uncharacterized phiE125 gp8 family phage protein
MGGPGSAEPLVSLAEAAAFLRLNGSGEEALLAGLIRSASGLCEAFLNQVVVARSFEEVVVASDSWTALSVMPVRSIDSLSMVEPDGTERPIAVEDYAVDVDADGRGWVRVDAAARRLKVWGSAGLAADVNEVPEPIRQGTLRLVAHLFTARDGGSGGEPPAAVTALWRPYRRMRLA